MSANPSSFEPERQTSSRSTYCRPFSFSPRWNFELVIPMIARAIVVPP